MPLTEITSLDTLSMAKICAAIGFAWGAIFGFGLALFMGAIVTVLSIAVPGSNTISASGVFISAFLGIWATMILSYTAVFFITGLVFAAVYNFAAHKTGGIKFKSRQVRK